MDSSPEGPLRSPDAATQYVQNLTAAEEVQDLGYNPGDFGDLFGDVANIPPVDTDTPRIGDPPPRQVAPPINTGIGTSSRQRPTEPPDNLIQQAMDEADIDTIPPIATGPGTTTTQPTRTRPPPTSSRSRARRRRTQTRRQTPTATATTTTASRSGARRRRNRQATATTTTTTAPARGRMQQQLRLLLDDIAADNREISNIVTTNTVTTTYKQNRRRPTVTNTRTRVGNNRRNRPTVSRTSTRVTP